jgi:hypothetical protein
MQMTIPLKRWQGRQDSKNDFCGFRCVIRPIQKMFKLKSFFTLLTCRTHIHALFQYSFVHVLCTSLKIYCLFTECNWSGCYGSGNLLEIFFCLIDAGNLPAFHVLSWNFHCQVRYVMTGKICVISLWLQCLIDSELLLPGLTVSL